MLRNIKKIIGIAAFVIVAIVICILFSSFIMNVILPVLAFAVLIFLIIMLLRRDNGK